MPAVPYTITLYSVTNAFGPFPMTLPAPTQGTIWVIRDVCFYLPSASGWLPVAHQASLLVGGNEVASTPPYRTVMSTLYETRDIRQTVFSGEVVQFQAGQPGWNLQVTGYAFS